MVRLRWYETKKGKEEIRRATDEYMQAVNKSEGFDVSGLGLPPRFCRGLLETICNNEDACSRLVLLYARLGLHRYNLLLGKNLQLSSVKKYNQSTGSAASTYYITLEATDPAIHDYSSSLQTFQTKVNELNFGKLVLSSTISRPLGETDIGEIIKRSITDHKPLKNFFFENTMPQWPQENPFQSSNRRRVLTNSEVKENDWIRLYLELAVATTNRGSAKNHDLSNLKIIKVAIDTNTQDDVDEALYPKDFVMVYIRYKDTCEARVGTKDDSDRVAIIRRFFNQRMGCLSITGQNLKIVIPNKKKKKKKQLLFSTSLRFKPLLRAYKYSGRLGLSSRKLHKTRSSIDYVVVNNEQIPPSLSRPFKLYNDFCSVH